MDNEIDENILQGHLGYFRVSHASVTCLTVMNDPYPGSDVSEKGGQVDCGVLKNRQETCREHLSYMDYKELVVNLKASVVN